MGVSLQKRNMLDFITREWVKPEKQNVALSYLILFLSLLFWTCKANFFTNLFCSAVSACNSSGLIRAATRMTKALRCSWFNLWILKESTRLKWSWYENRPNLCNLQTVQRRNKVKLPSFFFNQLFYLSIISWFIKYCPWFSSNIWSKGTIMKATDESGKMTTPSPVVSVTENGKCIVNISLESKRTNQTIFLWIIPTSHFMALSQKSMNVALFQRFVEYYRPTWNKIVRHIVWHKPWAPGFLFNWHIHPKGPEEFPILAREIPNVGFSVSYPFRDPQTLQENDTAVLTGIIEMSNVQC